MPTTRMVFAAGLLGSFCPPAAAALRQLAWKWHKALYARLLPVKDQKAGDKTEFQSEFLFNTRIHPLP
jgi:hypothetical protein